ncbi:Peptidase S8/S53 [Diaporthe amygdali]|uniref:Peptidase S8/S53 n=1 Tax=Phomopsis amygdali TaxID=1214568 RepID=UPI0022FF2D15|nr:Peptidase S8/S53 [Diaporthe amygdali]KAJ0119897.1 Peptidase S8/S53 [Diaporthe amygdali]
MASQEQFKKPDAKSFRDFWEKDRQVPGLTDRLIQTLRSASAVRKKETVDHNSLNAIINDIIKFLYHENSEIDSCVRWAILHRAVQVEIEKGETPQDNAPALLVGAIADEEKYLAFETLNPMSSALRQECKRRLDSKSHSPDHSQFGKDLKKSPFFEALANLEEPDSSSNPAAFEAMVSRLETYCKEQIQVLPNKRRGLLQITSQDANSNPQNNSDTALGLLLNVLRRPCSFGGKKFTALYLASQDEVERTGDLGILKVLLKYPGITDLPSDTTFDDAMQGGKVKVIKAMLSVEELRGRFVTSENITKAMDNIVLDGDSDIKDRMEKVLNELLLHSNNLPKARSVFDDQVAQKIIERNLVEAWDKRPESAKLNDQCLLHIAVYHQRVNFVERFLKDYPASVSCKALVPGTGPPKQPINKNSSDKTGAEQRQPEGYYPLWYNRKEWDGMRWVDRTSDPNESSFIRQLLAPATIRQVEKMQRLLGIFREAEVDELCFEISQFNSKLYRVSEFIHSLINHQENAGLLWYEPTIKYARFPPLDVHIDDKEVFGMGAQEEHTEVFDILQWLKQEKRVKSIIELKVPDRLVNPHNELLIAKYVDDFAIEVLNWRFLDLSLSVFSADTVKPRIRELHLYSSGKRAAISHWFSDEGLITFPNANYIQKKLADFEIRWRQRREMQETRLKKPRESGIKFLLNKDCKSQLWNPTHERLTSLDELVQRAFPRISGFVRNYRNYVSSIPHVDSRDPDPDPGAGGSKTYQKKRKFRPTKVAIIDNGILSISPVSIETSLGSSAVKRLGKNKTSTKGATAPSLSLRTDTVAPSLYQKNEVIATPTSPPNGAVNGGGGSMHKAGMMSSGKTGARNTVAAAHRGTEDEDCRATKGRIPMERHGTLWSRIKEGKSFVDDDSRVSPWLFASDAHGTQMANLICSIDPACELYVAKVTDGNNFGISPERVIRAIEWAISKGVDIISMSFTMFEDRPALGDVIELAKKRGIVMMCSNHDEGANSKISYLAKRRDHTWVVTACDEYGFTPRDRDPPTGCDRYMFQGFNVAAGVIPFLESNDRISGSSVATAIASGISSLIISCARLNTCDPDNDWHGESCPGPCARLDGCNPARNSHDMRCPIFRRSVCVARTQDCEGENRRHIVAHFLKSMVSEQRKDEGYVLLEKFGGIDNKVKEGEDIYVDGILETWFSPAKLKEAVSGQNKGS